MKALVTGAGGFLGRHVVKQLIARGDSVRGFSRGQYQDLADTGMEMIRGDVCDESAVRRACQGRDVVFHTAAVAGIWGPWKRFHAVNTKGTEHVIEGCRAAGVPKLVFTSSPSVTFDGGDQENVDESVPYSDRWLCHYPHTKALAEQQVLGANSEALSTCALRPHLIWGPGDQHLIPRLLARARQGRLRRVGDGQNFIDTVYIDNAAEAHLLAADRLTAGSPVAGKAYFISQGEPVRCWEWIDQILELASLPSIEKSISLKSAWRMGAAMECLFRFFRIQSEPPMTRFLAAQLGTSHFFDISRARRDLAYSPTIETTEGMRRLAVELQAS
jgi:nucleoside-diphosphate-sugar epimerase